MRLIIDCGKDLRLKDIKRFFSENLSIAQIIDPPFCESPYDVKKTFSKAYKNFRKDTFEFDTIQFRSPISYLVNMIINKSDESEKIFDFILDLYGKYDEIALFTSMKDSKYNRVFKKVYQTLLKSKRRKFSITLTETFGIKNSIHDEMEASVSELDLVYPYTIVLDIDDILLYWFGNFYGRIFDFKESEELLKRIPPYWPINDFSSYFIKGELEYNLEKHVGDTNLLDANIVILTARGKNDCPDFLYHFGQTLSSIFSKKYPRFHFNPEKNILANSYFDIFKGATLFKGYCIGAILFKIASKFMNSNEAKGLSYIDDRVKYVDNAFYNIKKINSELMKRFTNLENDPYKISIQYEKKLDKNNKSLNVCSITAWKDKVN